MPSLSAFHHHFTFQQLAVLEKDLPETWKLAIATKIENNLLARVCIR
jgi:hypothetical protein